MGFLDRSRLQGEVLGEGQGKGDGDGNIKYQVGVTTDPGGKHRAYVITV